MSSVLTARGMNRVNEVVSVQVNVNKELHQFRHASELTKEAKGGYLIGSVRILDLPDDAVITSIVLDLVQNRAADLHPAVLHITPKERKERRSVARAPSIERNRVMQCEDCQVELVFSGEALNVSHTYTNGSLDVRECWDETTRTLELGNDKLQLTIVKPKQKGESNSKNELFVEPVLDVKSAKTNKPKVNPKDFTATRGKEEPRDTSLFKAFLCATVTYVIGAEVKTVTGVSAEPVFDKGKYDFRAKCVHPKSICNGRQYQITVLMDTLKITGDIPIIFKLLESETNDELVLLKKEKFHGHFDLVFEQARLPGMYHLMLSIEEANVIVPESEQYFELKVRQHSGSDCYPCEEATATSGPIKLTKRQHEVTDEVQPKRRATDRRRSSGSLLYQHVVRDLDFGFASPESGYNTSPGQTSNGYDFSNSPQVYPSAPIEERIPQEIIFGSRSETDVEDQTFIQNEASQVEPLSRETEEMLDQLIEEVERNDQTAAAGQISSQDQIMFEQFLTDDETQEPLVDSNSDPMWTTYSAIQPQMEIGAVYQSMKLSDPHLETVSAAETDPGQFVVVLEAAKPVKKFNIASMCTGSLTRPINNREEDRASTMTRRAEFSPSRPVSDLPVLKDIDYLTSGLPDSLVQKSKIDSDGRKVRSIERKLSSTERLMSRRKSRSRSAYRSFEEPKSTWSNSLGIRTVLGATIAVCLGVLVFRFWPSISLILFKE